MEPANPELLSRDDITRILNERHLNIPKIELLTYEDLLRIYKTFAVPLEKRQPKRLVLEYSPEEIDTPPNWTTPYIDLVAENLIFNEHLYIPHEPHILQQTKLLKLSYNTIANSARKRFSDLTLHGMEEGTPAKRRPMVYH